MGRVLTNDDYEVLRNSRSPEDIDAAPSRADMETFTRIANSHLPILPEMAL